MGPFRNILVVIDPEAATTDALWRAAEVARRDGGRLTAAAVVEPLTRRIPLLSGGGRAEQLHELAVSAVQQQLDELAGQLSDVDVDVRVLSGRPFLEITRRVLEAGHDLVVVQDGTGRDSGLSSTALHLVRKCPCPVWVLRTTTVTTPQRVLAAVDVDHDGDSERDLLNRRILALAASAASRSRGELHVAHAWRLPGESMLASGRARLPAEDLQSLLAAERERTRRSLFDLVGSADVDERVNLHHRKGNPADQLAAIVDDQGIDLLVLGTATSRAPGILIGNTAETVIQRVPCSILAVKPPGFVSPVTLEERDSSVPAA